MREHTHVPRISSFVFLLLRNLPKFQCDCESHLTRRGEPPTDRHSWAPRFRPLFVSEQFCPLFVSELPSSLHERWRMRCKNWFLLENFVSFWGELSDVFLSEWFTVCWRSSILVVSETSCCLFLCPYLPFSLKLSAKITPRATRIRALWLVVVVKCCLVVSGSPSQHTPLHKMDKDRMRAIYRHLLTSHTFQDTLPPHTSHIYMDNIHWILVTQFESFLPRNCWWCAEHKTASTPILCPDY